MSRRILIWVAVAAFVVNLFWVAPAGIVYALVMPANAPVTAVGISGTLGRGRLAALVVRGQPVLENLSWRWSPLWLLLGRIRLNLTGGNSDLHIQGALQESLGGVSLRGTDITGDLSKLIALTPLVFAPVSGLVDAHIDRARWHHGALVDLDGTINAQHVHWTLAQPPFLLGDYIAHISTTAKDIDAVLSSPSGPLMLSGNAQLVTDSGLYSLDVVLHADGNVNPLLLNLLRSLGQPDAQGHYHIQTHGALTPANPGPTAAATPNGAEPAAAGPAPMQTLPAPPAPPPQQQAPTSAPSFAPAPAGPSPQSADTNTTIQPPPEPPPNAGAIPGQAQPPPQPPTGYTPGEIRPHRLFRGAAGGSEQ